MKETDHQLHCDEELGICGLSPEEMNQEKLRKQKRIELYVFTDPLCPECWAFEPSLKKLMEEYGHYFSLRFFLTTQLDSWTVSTACQKKNQKNLADLYEKTASRTGMSCDGDVWLENPIDSPHSPSLAVKAAEMQGRQLATVFLRRLREMLFLRKQNIADEEILIKCAEEVGLDKEEFKHDMKAQCTVKALQCDMKTTMEMEVDRAPTFIFFNDRVEDGGLKVSGLYPFEIYVEILKEMLGEKPFPSQKGSLIDFLKRYQFVATKEVSVVFDWNEREANAQLKKLVLQRQIEQVPVKYGTFWRYIG